jgi:hypothetical protein
VSTFYEDAAEMLRIIDAAGIQPGAVQFIPYSNAVEIDTWYGHGRGTERAAADAVVELLFGIEFEYQMVKEIGFANFKGTWRSLKVKVTASDSAGYCTRVQVGERIEPAQEAQPERVVPVYEWTCNDPILASEVAA